MELFLHLLLVFMLGAFLSIEGDRLFCVIWLIATVESLFLFRRLIFGFGIPPAIDAFWSIFSSDYLGDFTLN